MRELVIQSLVKVIIDPDSKPGQITAAAKVLGTVTEVAAFTERKEVRTITSSEDARASIMAQLKELSKASAEDAHIIDEQADSLLAELEGRTIDEELEGEPHPVGTPQTAEPESLSSMHTIPHKQSPQNSAASLTSTSEEFPAGEDPPSSTGKTPPSSLES